MCIGMKKVIPIILQIKKISLKGYILIKKQVTDSAQSPLPVVTIWLNLYSHYIQYMAGVF